MKYTSKQTGNSRNNALLRRAARLGYGISMVAMSAMLTARPAKADPRVTAAEALSNAVPSESSSSAFVTSGSDQQNTGNAISAQVNDAFGGSKVENTTGFGALPSTATVTGNDLAAYATGNAQTTNTVDLATIGTGTNESNDDSTGIAVLADQANIYHEFGEDSYTPATINAAVIDSELNNETTNAVSGNTLTDSNNLITAQVSGNAADSSVTGVVPINYDTPEPGGVTMNTTSADATGNVVVATSQTNTALYGGVGSFATVGGNEISLYVDASGEDAQSLALATTDSRNAISSDYLGNSAVNDIGVALTSGTVTGAPTLDGSLVISNQQASTGGLYDGGTISGVGAFTTFNSVGTEIYGGDDEPPITLTDGVVTVDNNVISSSATNNSAVGAAGAPGNEISLGINLAGATSAGDSVNTISGSGELGTGADLALSNQQYEGGPSPLSTTKYFGIYTGLQNLAGSTAQVSNDTASSNAMGNNASNVIDTASAAGIDLISGLAALTSQQAGQTESPAVTEYGDIRISAGYSEALSLTNSSLNLAGDQITSNAGINLVTNTVSLAASTINAGPQGAAVAPATLSGSFGLDAAQTASAGLSLSNQQLAVEGGFANAYVAAVDIAAYVSGNTLSNNSLVITNPALSAIATANSATNSISADGSQGISGSVGLANTQLQFSAGADASLTAPVDDDGEGGVVAISEESGPGGITGNSALLSGTSLAAEATDNYASNTLDATGGTLANTVSGTLGLAAQLSDTLGGQAIADLALGNAQYDLGASAYANSYYAQTVLDANSAGGTISGSTFTISGPANNAPTNEALAIGNEALNVLSAAASTVMQDTAGLLNVQANGTGAQAIQQYANVYAALNSTPVDVPEEDGNDGGNVSNTSVVVGTGAVGGSNPNILRALAYGNQATNQLSASAGSLTPADMGLSDYAVNGSVIDGLDVPYDTSLSAGSQYAVGAAYALLNDQSAENTISSTVFGADVGAYIGNGTTNPTVTNVTESTAGNAVLAAAYGNQADNSGSVSAGNLSIGAYTPLADVTNIQTGNTTYEASLSQPTDDGYDTFISQVDGTGAVTDSTIGVTNNTALTQVEANDAVNSLATSGGNIADTASTALPAVEGYTYDAGTDTASAAFSVQNVQYDGSAVRVAQPQSDALVSIGGAVDISTLTADGNAFQANGYENNATNSLGFGGTSSPVDLLDTSSALQSVQYADGSDNVTLGSPGTLATAGTPPTVLPAVTANASPSEDIGVLSNSGTTLQIEGQPLVFNLSTLSSTQRTEFEALFTGGSATESGTSFTLAAGTYTLSSTDLFGTSDGNIYNSGLGGESNLPVGSVTLNDGTPGTPYVPPSPDVLITVGGNVTASTLDVSNNAFDATALANNAVNTQNIAANTVNGGSGLTTGASTSIDGYDAETSADYVLSNLQSDASPVSATGYGEVGINPTNSSAFNDSSLSVSSNTQMTKAEADLASNTLTLAANDTSGTPPTMALTSYQYGDESVTATSGEFGSGDAGFLVTAPGAISNSTLTMDNNTSESLAVLNNATNLVSIAATTLDTSNHSPGNGGASTIDGDFTQADYQLTNAQLAQGNTVTATDVTQILNADDQTVSTSGLVSSAVDITGNLTSADAEANTANNTLDMSATNSTATGALLNQQASSTTVSASGAATVGFGLSGNTDPGNPAASASAINVSNNSLQVQGVGNQATNALNADTGATYGTQTEATANDGEAGATYAVLNAQSNTANVSGQAIGEVYSGLDGGSADEPVSNTTVTVSYNVVDAKAFGNSATNSMTVATLNAGNATAALQNTQTNTGAVAAGVFNTGIGSYNETPGVSNVGVTVGNNSIVASAVGNAASNSIAH